jgi:small multidrug resistance pump
MEWGYLIIAILTEVAGTISLKLSDGFTRLAPTLLMIACYIVSLALLALVLKKMSVSVAYAIWSAVGTAMIATIGIVWFKEPATVLKIGSLGLVVVGVIGLNLTGGH